MKKWEYKFLRIDKKKVEPIINDFGKDGWELIASQFILFPVDKSSSMIFIFKREIL